MTRAAAEGMNKTLPDGFTWSDFQVLKCDTCGETEDLRTAIGSNPQRRFRGFLTKHSDCVKDAGRRQSSSMTVRESFAAHAMMGLLASEMPDERMSPSILARHAREYAEALIQVLGPQAEVEHRALLKAPSPWPLTMGSDCGFEPEPEPEPEDEVEEDTFLSEPEATLSLAAR